MLRTLIFALTVLSALPAGLSVVSRANPEFDCDCYTTVPFYRGWNADVVDHFYTTNLREITNAGMTRQRDAGRVLAGNAPRTGAVPLYRLFNPGLADHFYTVSDDERATVLKSGGWNYEGIAAYILAQPACGTIPLYRLLKASGSDHFYTADAAEMVNVIHKDGYEFESTIGYIWPNATSRD